jgi:hypothetical protein
MALAGGYDIVDGGVPPGSCSLRASAPRKIYGLMLGFQTSYRTLDHADFPWIRQVGQLSAPTV